MPRNGNNWWAALTGRKLAAGTARLGMDMIFGTTCAFCDAKTKGGVAAPAAAGLGPKAILCKSCADLFEAEAEENRIKAETKRLQAEAEVKRLPQDLIDAAKRGDAIVVQPLLTKGADVNAKDKDGYTALMSACEKGHFEVVQALLDRGADVNAKTEPLNFSWSAGQVSRAHGNKGVTALMMAAENGHLKVVRALLAKGADVSVKAWDGGTALLFASQNRHREVVQALLDKGGDVDWELILASEPDVVRALLAKGADVNARTNKGWTALHFASQNGQLDVVRALLDAKGADVNANTSNGETPLMVASRNGHREVVQALLTKAAEVNAKSNDGKTAVMLATDANVRALLMQAGANLATTSPAPQPASAPATQHVGTLASPNQSSTPPRIWTVPVGKGVRFPGAATRAQAIVKEWGNEGEGLKGKTAPGVVWDLAAREANGHRCDVAGEFFRFFYDWLSKYGQAPSLQLTVAAASAVCLSRADGEDWPPSRSYFPNALHENDRWREALGNLATATFIAHAARERLVRPTGGTDSEVQVDIGGTRHSVRAIVERTIPKIAIIPYTTNSELDRLANSVSRMNLTFPVRHMIGGAEDWW